MHGYTTENITKSILVINKFIIPRLISDYSKNAKDVKHKEFKNVTQQINAREEKIYVIKMID